MKKSVRSYIHVVLQFTSILYILISGPKMANAFLVVPEITGLLLGIWSVWLMQKSVLSIFPVPNEEAILIKTGPYQIIRHPMYLALFLVLIPLVITKPTQPRIIVSVVFAVNQIIKLIYEESLLTKFFPNYKEYCKNTFRIIPFIY